MPCLGTSICACARTCACAMACEAGVGGGGWCWGSGLSRCKPRDCLRQAKGAPDGDGTAGRRVSWKPNANAERLAGCAEATQVCSGSRGPGQPLPAAREGLGLDEGMAGVFEIVQVDRVVNDALAIELIISHGYLEREKIFVLVHLNMIVYEQQR